MHEVSSTCQTHKNNFQSTQISSKYITKHSVKGIKTYVYFALIKFHLAFACPQAKIQFYFFSVKNVMPSSNNN
jgi:hypothetical protein